MIIEKRKYIRKQKSTETDWKPEPNFVEIEHWGDIRLPVAIPKLILFIGIVIAGLFGYLLGSFF